MDNAQEITRDFNWLVLDTIRRMRDARAQGDLSKYCNYVEDALQLIQPYLDLDFRSKLNKDKKTLEGTIKEIKEKKKVDETSKNKEILDLRLSFADAHKALIYSALPSIGVVKIGSEGVIDLTKYDTEMIKSIVRASGRGLEKAVKEAVDGHAEK